MCVTTQPFIGKCIWTTIGFCPLRPPGKLLWNVLQEIIRTDYIGTKLNMWHIHARAGVPAFYLDLKWPIQNHRRGKTDMQPTHTTDQSQSTLGTLLQSKGIWCDVTVSNSDTPKNPVPNYVTTSNCWLFTLPLSSKPVVLMAFTIKWPITEPVSPAMEAIPRTMTTPISCVLWRLRL